jgi:hypothetical protein
MWFNLRLQGLDQGSNACIEFSELRLNEIDQV